MPTEYKPKVKFFITTKADIATEKVNKWLEEHYDSIDVLNIKPFMSYTTINNGSKDNGAYMIGCMISYLEVPPADKTYIVDAPFPMMKWQEEV